MYSKLFSTLKSKSSNWKNEEEVRIGWISALSNTLKIEMHAERGRKDSSYNKVVIEFKDRGLFKGKTSSRSFKEAIYERLLPYIIKTSEQEGIDRSDYIGVATDAEHICFAQVKDDNILFGHLLPVSEPSLAMLATALNDKYRRALTSDSLIWDFGHTSECGVAIMSALANALSKSITSPENNKAKMLFEEWRTLFGQVADLSVEQIEGINKTLRFKIASPKLDKIPASLFVIHTYNSIIIKLLAAEIISVKNLTSYRFFAQNLSVKTDDEIILKLRSEIEGGEYFARVGIKGFVEEVLFSWYLDICDDSELKSEIVSAIRSILVKLSFYRADNLTQAKSQDLLKLFYQNLVPETLRKSLGEFYTPDWLVCFTLDRAGVTDWLKNRSLDPTCGSGSFLLEIIRRKIKAATIAGWTSEQILKHLTQSTWGFDLNPLAVQTARVNFLIAISEFLFESPGQQIEIPILLADAIYSPTRDPQNKEKLVTYRIGSKFADLEIELPEELAFNRERLDTLFSSFSASIEDGIPYDRARIRLLSQKALSTHEADKWHNALQNTYNKVLQLHSRDWNGIWFRVVRNFFWSSVAGNFDLIAGNPPWVRWSKLPDLYRERVKKTCLAYNIFSNTPHHGGNELDISGMVTYAVADKWLSKNGTLAFIITQTHFQSPSSQGFRDFKINKKYGLIPVSVDDMKELKPFPDAANKTAVVIFKKEINGVPKYPVTYNLWKANEGFSKAIPVKLRLHEVISRIHPLQLEATPVTDKNSPWAILPKGRFKQLAKLTGQCDWTQGRKGITADINGIYFVNIVAQNLINGLVKIRTRPDAGRTDIGPAQDYWIEPNLLYPLIKGASDFSRCYFRRVHDLFTFVPNNGITAMAYEKSADTVLELPKTSRYFSNFKTILEARSTYRLRMKNGPYYSVYNVGEYTFAPWKVIWAEQKDFCAAVVSSSTTPMIGTRPYIPDHKIFFTDCYDAEVAYFLCGLLNTDIVIEYVKSHNISIQIGDIFKHMRIPKYDRRNPLHLQLSKMTEKCHLEDDANKRQGLITEISKVGEQIIV
jgi:hypothetical protein